jgi:hypothetical protein
MVRIKQSGSHSVVYLVDPKKESVEVAFKDICKNCRIVGNKKTGTYPATKEGRADMDYCVECGALAKRKAIKGEPYEVTVITSQLPEKLQKHLEEMSFSMKESSATKDVQHLFPCREEVDAEYFW